MRSSPRHEWRPKVHFDLERFFFRSKSIMILWLERWSKENLGGARKSIVRSRHTAELCGCASTAMTSRRLASKNGVFQLEWNLAVLPVVFQTSVLENLLEHKVSANGSVIRTLGNALPFPHLRSFSFGPIREGHRVEISFDNGEAGNLGYLVHQPKGDPRGTKYRSPRPDVCSYQMFTVHLVP